MLRADTCTAAAPTHGRDARRDLGHLRQALKGLRSSVEALASLTAPDRRRLGLSPSCIPRTLGGLVRTLTQLGEFRETLALGREAIQVAETTGGAVGIVTVSTIVGMVALDLGDVAQAWPLLERSRRLSRERDLANPLVWATAALGAAHVLDGHPATGVPLIEEALGLAESNGDIQGYALWATWLGDAYLAVGPLDDTGAVARTTLDFADRHREVHHHAYALRLLGDAAASGDTSQAVETVACYRDTVALSVDIGMRPVQTHCHLGLAKLYRRTGRYDEVRAELSMAVAMLREMGMPYWLPEAERELTAANG